MNWNLVFVQNSTYIALLADMQYLTAQSITDVYHRGGHYGIVCKQSNTGCILYEEKIQVNDTARQFAYKLELDPTACALSGGEDYELLFTIDQSDYDKIFKNTDISIVGHITEKKDGAIIITRGGNQYPLTAQGWNALQ